MEAGILIDLFLSYRAVKGYEEMVSLAERVPRPLARTPMVREQVGLALNRRSGDRRRRTSFSSSSKSEAPASETYGILGRVTRTSGPRRGRPGTPSWLRGCSTRPPTPTSRGSRRTGGRPRGINAVTLMEISDPPDDRRHHLMPVVCYASERRFASGEADYWDHATRLELAVLAKDEPAPSERCRGPGHGPPGPGNPSRRPTTLR